jgi:hypothetical protein
VGQTAIERDSWPMRRVAAEARRVLLEMASTRLVCRWINSPLATEFVTVKADPSKRITYGELIGGKKIQRHAERQQYQRGQRSS